MTVFKLTRRDKCSMCGTSREHLKKLEAALAAAKYCLGGNDDDYHGEDCPKGDDDSVLIDECECGMDDWRKALAALAFLP